MSTLLAMPPAWAAGYVGLPYVLGGRGPDAYDCWGLVRHVLGQQFGVAVPDVGVERYPDDGSLRALGSLLSAGIDAESLHWRPVARREGRAAPLTGDLRGRAGDVAVLRYGRAACHVGVLVCPGWLLHTEEAPGCQLQRLADPLLAPRLVALYRHRSREAGDAAGISHAA